MANPFFSLVSIRKLRMSTLLVFNSETRNFSSWQGNRGVVRRRTLVRRTIRLEADATRRKRSVFRMETSIGAFLRHLQQKRESLFALRRVRLGILTINMVKTLTAGHGVRNWTEPGCRDCYCPAAIAAICAAVRGLRKPMPPVLALMAA